MLNVRMSGRSAPAIAGAGQACASPTIWVRGPRNADTSEPGLVVLNTFDELPDVSRTFFTIVLMAGRPMRSICDSDPVGSENDGAPLLLFFFPHAADPTARVATARAQIKILVFISLSISLLLSERWMPRRQCCWWKSRTPEFRSR